MKSLVNLGLLKTCLLNALKYRLSSGTGLRPFFVSYYVTFLCNFRCSYCGFAQSGKVSAKDEMELSTGQSIRLLKSIRKECANIYFTGGEPLIRPDIAKLMKASKKLKFKTVTLNTNLSLYNLRKEILDYVDYLVVSLDSMDHKANAESMGVSEKTVRDIICSLEECATLQKEKGFKLIVNCVCTPATIKNVREVMAFCFKNNIMFAFVPAGVGDSSRFVDKGFVGNSEYESLVDFIIAEKKNKKPVFNSYSYLGKIRDFKSFRCLPSLSPHINARGELFYPCEPMQKASCSLLSGKQYSKIMRKCEQDHGMPPACTNSCYKSCYLETSQFVTNPFRLITELLNKIKEFF